MIILRLRVCLRVRACARAVGPRRAPPLQQQREVLGPSQFGPTQPPLQAPDFEPPSLAAFCLQRIPVPAIVFLALFSSFLQRYFIITASSSSSHYYELSVCQKCCCIGFARKLCENSRLFCAVFGTKIRVRRARRN